MLIVARGYCEAKVCNSSQLVTFHHSEMSTFIPQINTK